MDFTIQINFAVKYHGVEIKLLYRFNISLDELNIFH